eukprot:TRINITY_DN4447_c0_g1_i3.p1 TRINITY_DN4447_c0_g1~~TRINITY_DN4447_c0_g1_i3.p1  ORF type:complete len:767 (+),score=122.14 TRINITY_DN4447_c0_g1_i3:256-2556(+)
MIWALHLGDYHWKPVHCTGYIPLSRTYHSAVTYAGHMLVYGGVLVGDAEEPDSCPYYELDLETFDWMRVQTFGTNPGLRSHHTASVANTSMIVLGGQDLSKGPDHQITNIDLKESIVAGFYDIFMLDIGSRTWTKIERFDEGSPKLWGHTAVTFNHQYILVYGGFDVNQTEEEGVVQAQPGDPPSCSISGKVYILNLNDYSWRSSTPSANAPSPIPRAMHVAVTYGNEMLIFGGMTFDPTGRAININDSWLWDIANGSWYKMEFCVPYWPSKRLLCTVHNGRFYVCNDLLSVHSFDFSHKELGWTRNSTDPSAMFEGSEPGKIAPWDVEVPQDPTIAPIRQPPPQAAVVRFADSVPTPPAALGTTSFISDQTGSRVRVNEPADRRESPFRMSRVRRPAPQPQPQPPRPQPPRPAPQSIPRNDVVIENNQVIRGLQDQQQQLQNMLREAERSRQAQNIARLQSEMTSLKDELEQLSLVKERIFNNSNQLNSSLESPSRKNPTLGLPDGTGPTSIQAHQVTALQHYLDSLQTQQQSILLEQKRRHEQYLDDIKQGHDAQMSMIQDRNETQQKAHQQLAEVQNNLELEQKQQQQIELIKSQFDNLMALQGSNEVTNAGTNIATTGLPTAAEEMAGVINQMNRIPNVASSPSPAWPSNLTHNLNPTTSQVPVRFDGSTPLPIPIPNHVHTANEQIPLNSRKVHHIEGLRRQLQSLESNPHAHDKIRSPFRAVSMASSSPGPYWDRLKDILGTDDYVAVGDNLVSPSARVI